MNAIKVKNLSKKYDQFALNSINFALPYGTIMGLIGENGAGKSTTIKLIMNAISADSGDVVVLGCENTSSKFIDIKEQIGVVLDETHFCEIFSIKKIEKIMQSTYHNWDSDLFFSYIERFSLPLEKKLKHFSRGMKMKLSIAVALSHHPKLLILDEPTSGLDPMVREEILDIFNEFTRDENNSILISSHIISDLEKICDYLTFIHDGSIVLSDEKDLILNQYAIIKLSEENFSDIPHSAIVSKKKTAYGYHALVFKDLISDGFKLEKTTLEDIILFLSKKTDGKDDIYESSTY